MITRLTATIIFVFAFTCQALSIEVSGDVWGEWESSNNPYLVTGNLRVPTDSTLSILPGCRIEFQGHYKFMIDSLSSFRAIGTESDSITFTNLDTLEGWHGIRFYWADSSCELAYCRLEWGRAADHYPDPILADGGAVWCFQSGLQVSNCLFHFNRAWEGFGGAIYAGNSNLNVSACSIVHNRCGSGGAAIYAIYSDVVIDNSNISMDTTRYALGGEWGGGAIGCLLSYVMIRSNVISQNFCQMAGGGLQLSSCRAIVENNTISYNGSWVYSGGIGIGGGLSMVESNLIYGNTTVEGGGGIGCGDSVTFLNNTIVRNFSYNVGGGIRCAARNSAPIIQNNIIWGNVAYRDSQITIWETSLPPIVTYSDVQGGWLGEGNIDANPLFCDTAHADFLLAANSPCVGTGYEGADIGAYGVGCEEQDIFEDIVAPSKLALFPNYPNPFNAQTTISYSLPQEALVTFEAFDITGMRADVAQLGNQRAGVHSFTWNAEALSSGIYFYRIKAESFSETKKCLLLK